MCSYCGCRSVRPIGDLSEEHEVIQNLCGDVRRAVRRGDHGAAAASLERLVAVLGEHDAVEELSLYPAMATHPEFADQVGTLFDEHDDLDALLDTALDVARDAGPDRVPWDRVLVGFETLVEHIQHEENGLFPAAAVALDPEDWERAERVRRDYRRTRPAVT